MNCEEARQSLDAFCGRGTGADPSTGDGNALVGMRFLSRRGRTDYQLQFDCTDEYASL